MDQLANYLGATISPNDTIRKEGENYLRNIEKNQGFGEGLFLIISSTYPVDIKIASAITFKNFVKRNWVSEEVDGSIISHCDREFIKSNIVELMLNNIPTIQNQLSESVSIIGKSDFPDKWESLLPQLINKINEGNFHIINGVLRTFHSLFKRYRYESRSNELWIEIKKVIEQLGLTLNNLIQQTMNLINENSNDKDALMILWNSILLIEKIFLSLNHQDLPEFYEDHMGLWMGQFHLILQHSNPLLTNKDKDEVGILEQVKSHICDIISLYARNYDEEFNSYISVFIEDILQVLLATTNDSKYDTLVSNALHFLSMVADRAHHRDMFISKINLQQLSQDIIIPNIQFQESDQELFLDNPDEYIRRDIEGSHSDTRRKSACELVKSLCRMFEQQVVNNFIVYIQELLKKYTENNVQNWKMKDSALFLITSVASKGETGRHGVTATTEFVDIKDFYKAHVLPELQGEMKGNSVIKADCIKYLMTFRSIIPAEELRLSINLLIQFAADPSHVVHSYAAAAINKLLMVRDPLTNTAIINAQHLYNPVLFVSSLCDTMRIPGSEDNIYAMQATMRTISTLQDKSMDCMSQLVEYLQNKLLFVVKNPRKPIFNHSLIETISLCIKIVCGANKSFVSTFEMILCPIFNTVLSEDIEEFVPYAFQLFSLMLDQHPDQQITKPYEDLFPFLVHPSLWERIGNIPSLIRLLLSYLEKANWSIISHKLQDLVNIFQRLNRSRTLDTFGFMLLSAIIIHVPRQYTESYLRTVFEAIFHRLTQNKTPRYMKAFVLFFTSLVVTYPPSDIIQLINKIQTNLFQMILENLILPTITKMDTRIDKKISVVGITRMLVHSNELIDGPYSQYWSILLTKLVESLATFNDCIDVDTEIHFVDIETNNTTTAHNQLVFVGKKVVDPAIDVNDPRLFLGDQLKKLSATNAQRFPILYNGIDGQVQMILAQILANVGLAL